MPTKYNSSTPTKPSPTKPKTKKTTLPPPPVEPVVEPEETVTFKRGHFYSFMVVMALCLGLILGYFVGQRNSSAPTNQIAQAVPTAIPAPLKYNITTAGFPSIGPANAPIVIVEFSDYQCPYCTQWHDTTYKPLLAAYPGKI